MDPGQGHRAWPSRRGLPRARGDGPSSGCRAIGDGSPAPAGMDPALVGRRRGSPAPAGMDPTRPTADSGSPAPAGMDPAVQRTARCATLGFPRARGDGPGDRTLSALSAGSPAPAGMDPSAAAECMPRARLPRARGDGPVGVPRAWPIAMAPPRPRGWTRRCGDGASAGPGSPAPAGMDPLRQRTARRGYGGFPAPAGMDPAGLHTGGASRRAPPRPRGWTRRRALAVEPPMAPPRPRGWTPAPVPAHGAVRLPRARGDGPFAREDHGGPALQTAPAHVGMNPGEA